MAYEDYLRSLDSDALEAYAKRAGTTVDYIQIGIIPRKRVPRKGLMMRLADAAPGVPALDVLQHFYPEMFAEVGEAANQCIAGGQGLD